MPRLEGAPGWGFKVLSEPLDQLRKRPFYAILPRKQAFQTQDRRHFRAGKPQKSEGYVYQVANRLIFKLFILNYLYLDIVSKPQKMGGGGGGVCPIFSSAVHDFRSGRSGLGRGIHVTIVLLSPELICNRFRIISAAVVQSQDGLTWRCPCDRYPRVGREAHATADREVGATCLRTGS